MTVRSVQTQRRSPSSAAVAAAFVLLTPLLFAPGPPLAPLRPVLAQVVAESQSGDTETSTISTEGDAAAPDDQTAARNALEDLIRQKSEELQKVNQQLDSASSDLESTQREKANLESELRRLQANVNQLELNIQADEIATQKLGLEIDSLQYDIRDIELGVQDKNAAIGHVLRQLQRNDSSNLLIVFLRNNSLADGFWESQSLKNLRSQLALDIANLKALQVSLDAKVGLVSAKKSEVEAHRRDLAARKSITQDQQQERKVILVQTKNKESVYTAQVAELKKQQDDISDEIARFEEQLRASFDPSLLPIPRGGFFAWPVEMAGVGGRGRVTQHFGETSYLYRGKPHNGLDIGAPIGTAVMAADDGVVIAVDNNDRSQWNKYQYGKYVLVRHKTNLTTLYAHLSKQIVAEGDTVSRGQVVGYIGSTGYATGPHLHFGVYWAPSVLMKSVPPAAGLVPIGVVIKPEDYL